MFDLSLVKDELHAYQVHHIYDVLATCGTCRCGVHGDGSRNGFDVGDEDWQPFRVDISPGEVPVLIAPAFCATLGSRFSHREACRAPDT